MLSISELRVYGGYQVVMASISEMTAALPSTVQMVGESECYAISSNVNIGDAEFPFITGIGSDEPYSVGNATFPFMFQNSGEGGFFVPTPITIGFATFPKLGGSGVAKTVHPGGGTATFPFMTGLGGDFQYGVGSANFPFLTSFGMYGLPNTEVEMIDFAYFGGAITSNIALTVVFVSEGVISDTMSLNRIQAVQFIEELTASDTMTVLGTFTQSFVSELIAVSAGVQTVISSDSIEKPSLDTEGMVWVVNADTGASSQYEQYGFNSFFTRDGESFGVAEDGIYRLHGDDDVGLNISALADFGRSNFGTSFKKKCPYIYLGVGSDGMLYLKVDADGESYVYEMRNNSEAIENHRVDVGKGLEGNFWNFTLINKDGSDFDLATVQFEPLISSRRIK